MTRGDEDAGAVPGGAGWIRAFLAAACVAGLLGLGAVVLGVRDGTGVNHVAASWTALATDLSQGLFYRPLHADGIGYGGTRFFPLFFCLQALLIRAGLAPVVAGHVIGLLAGALLLGGAYVLLRRLAVARPLAAGLTALLPASVIVQHGFATIRGDVLPLALNLWGLAAFLARHDARRPPVAPALLFVLAFAAKPTALYGAAALGLWLLAEGRRRDAAALAGLVALGGAVVIGVTEAASAGRFLAILRACASGGATAGSALAAPGQLAGMFLWKDPWGVALVGAACLAGLARFRACARSLPGILLAATLGATLVIFATPGITWNHLVDLVAAAAVCLGVAAGRAPPAHRRVLAPLLVLLAVGAVLPAGAALRAELAAARAGAGHERRDVVAAIAPGPGAILSEDPLVPIIAGERPYLLDAFMVRLVAERDPRFADDLAGRLRDGAFRAVVFLDDPATHRDWYATVHFGPKVMQAVAEGYEPAARVGRYVVYERRPTALTSPPVAPTMEAGPPH